MSPSSSVRHHVVHQHHDPGRKPVTADVTTRDIASGASSPRTSARNRVAALAFAVVVLMTVRTGWQNRTTMLLTAESGAGYALGIIGALLMLALLLYPLRKRARFMRNAGPVRHWFRAHMMLGIIGPLCILFHASFQWGSLNSNVALICMLLVAGSGLVGRYIYTRIHHGLYGHRASLAGLRQQAADVWSRLAATTELPQDLSLRLHRLEQAALAPAGGLLDGAVRAIGSGVAMPWHRYCARRDLRRHVLRNAAVTLDTHQRRQLYRDARRHVSAYIATVRKLAVLGFYERVFALWHVLHMPLFVMLLVTGVVHVLFVHMY